MYVQKDWMIHGSNDDRNSDSPLQGLAFAEQILRVRGVEDPDEVNRFLHPDIRCMHDPFLFHDMHKACRIIAEHARRQNTIVVFGDYDVDGLTATAVLVRGLQNLGIVCLHNIPDRLQDGYGLSQASLPRLLEYAPDLVITVDCGIASNMEVESLVAKNIDVIITDHHECQDVIPPAHAVLNPKQPGSCYPFQGLSGAGVALKLLQALASELGQPDSWQEQIPLAALGTVADVVPLLDENRILVHVGLQKINEQHPDVPAGILALLTSCQKTSLVTASTLGYTIAPRLNAAGRMGDVQPAMELLLDNDPEKCRNNAECLNNLNRQRQHLETQIMQEAIQMIEVQSDACSLPILIAAEENWHPGVIGIVCSRLVERFARPVILLAGAKDSTLRGSCRTCGNFDILAALQAAGAFTIGYGGHTKAAGVELAWQQLPDFADAIIQYARSKTAAQPVRPVLYADLRLAAEDMTLENARSLALLEPFGEGNQQPLFVAEDFSILQWRLVGNGRHVKLSLRSADGFSAEAVAFGLSETDELYKVGDQVDILFALEINNWRNQDSVQLRICDFKHHASGRDFHDKPWLADEMYRNNHTIQELSCHYQQPTDTLLPDAEDYKMIYQYLRTRFEYRTFEFDVSILARLITVNYRKEISAFKLSRVLQVFDESGLISLERLQFGRCRAAVREVRDKIRLESVPSYRRLQAERVLE